jgi:HNH endonuclease
MNKNYARVAQRAGHRCEYCRAPEIIFNMPFDVEHIVPASQERLDDESNFALACRACNVFKSDQQSGVDEATGERAQLFHPRHDRWDEHFRVDLHDGRIAGLTPVGRVTVACLRLNRDIQREARNSWIRLKLYP